MNYEKFYLIGFWIATLYAFVMLPYNLERMQRVDSIETKTTTNTELLETEEDWKENLSATLQTLWTLIPQASAKEEWKNVIDVQEKHSTILKYGNDEKSLKQSVTLVNLKKKEKTEDWVIEKIRTPYEIYEQVKHLWFREAPTISLISTCKASSRDPRHCILVWLTLMYNEAGNQQKSIACTTRNNCFWVQSWKKVYSSLDEWMENWVQRYNRYWYKADNAKYFYPDLWKVAPTNYCSDEKQHYPNIWCPDGQKIATDKWSKLYPIIY